ncbi:hypothetical protein VPNG_02948 [Cytospora leucostoma]|uniref:Heterokaryon incompatibility domain-containing protein n=1 Tax=Cytospora leucostoma TaxID=1230097 RepID=A0A423XGJ0_9PEZI|nr:hypothetical protein VPNG_02948 [Cytospora leucostoma]
MLKARLTQLLDSHKRTTPSTDPSPLRNVKDMQVGLVPLQRLDLHTKQIRILRVLPGRYDDPIECELYTAHLGDRPYYEALSYVWGDPTICKPIFLEGREVQVTTNLRAALRSLRLRDKIRHMWVDALCIDQTDDIEKSHQVNLMKIIYEQTARALLWLGGLHKSRLFHGDNTHTTIGRRDARNALKLILKIANAVEGSIGSLDALMGLSWWERIWTVQEAVLPHEATVSCGNLSLDWSTFIRAHRTLSLHISHQCCLLRTRGSSYGLAPTRFAPCVSGIEACRGPSLQLTGAFESHHRRKGGDSRDQLYALLGLKTDWGGELSTLVDYSVSPGEVFRKMTTVLIRLDDNLKPLTRLRQPSADAYLPTWVHDLSATPLS